MDLLVEYSKSIISPNIFRKIEEIGLLIGYLIWFLFAIFVGV